MAQEKSNLPNFYKFLENLSLINTLVQNKHKSITLLWRYLVKRHATD